MYRTDGFSLGEPDLLDEESGLVGEYDGSTHRSLERHTHDNQREEWMEHAGLVVTRATSIDLGPRRRGLVGRLRAGYARAMARDASTRRWRLEGLPSLRQRAGRSRSPRTMARRRACRSA